MPMPIYRFSYWIGVRSRPICGLCQVSPSPMCWPSRACPYSVCTLSLDYGFNSWPEPKVGSFNEIVRKAEDYDAAHPWSTKEPKLFWKGALLTDMRRKLMDSARGWPWARIEEVDWRNKDTVITMDDHCGFKYLGHVEGLAYSGRLKYILMCKSVTVSHEMEYVGYA